MSAGYVGLFSLWDRIRADLSYSERMLIAAFIAISLTLYVGWTLKTQWTLAQQHFNFSGMMSAIDLNDPKAIQEMSDKFRAQGATVRASVQRYLPLVMGSAITFAALAAVIMVIECFAHIAGAQH
jgi:hypothetical protein